MAELAVADILAKVRKRRSRHVGIGIASDYVSTIGSCFGQEGSEKFFGMGSDRQWAQALKDAQQKLVYRDEDMKVIEVKRALAVASKQRKYPAKKGGKKEGEEDGNTGLTPGACMEFDCVLTSSKRDRDRDILEPSGARVDPSMPLLWQHIPMQPIGKMLKVVEQTEEQVVVRCAIADNAFGRDVAQLVEFGALRISHGFVPTKFEPIEEDEDADPWMQGWHVLEYDVLEVSTVSIPSNTDAVITGFSRGKLHHPLVKSWAQAVSKARPTMVPVGEKQMTQPINVHVHLGDDLAAKAKKKDEDAPDKEGEEGEEEKMEVSELASLGRVHLMIEQCLKIDGLPEEATSLLNQAKGELEAAMNGEESEETEEEAEGETEEEAEEEPEEGKEGEEDEDKEGDEEEEPKEPGQMVGREGEDDDKEDEEDEEKEVEGEDEVEPGDDEGRADEGKGYDVADDLFQSALKKFKSSPPAPAKKPEKGKGKTAPKKGK